MLILDLLSVANAANIVQDQQKQKNIRNNPKTFTDAGNSADDLLICVRNTVSVYNRVRHCRQLWLAKMITIRRHVSLPNSFWPLLLSKFYYGHEKRKRGAL